MDKFLDVCNQQKLNQEGINHLNSPITYNEIETVIVDSWLNFIKPLKKN
jgi:hypothetical protein